MKQFLSVFLGDFENFFCLSICQISLLIYLNHWLQPYFAKMLCATLTNMHMSAILIVVCIPEKELPNDFCRDIEEYFWHDYCFNVVLRRKDKE